VEHVPDPKWLLLAAAAPLILSWIVIREHKLTWPQEADRDCRSLPDPIGLTGLPISPPRTTSGQLRLLMHYHDLV
jgi:hypothetical protein